ncbi:MAG: hypothetical protein PHV30_03190 [Candidatus Margulisbacteria bacterium]|nr:hypothetical protein [Candidatus Margulisiibacteriota bacterium]
MRAKIISLDIELFREFFSTKWIYSVMPEKVKEFLEKLIVLKGPADNPEHKVKWAAYVNQVVEFIRISSSVPAEDKMNPLKSITACLLNIGANNFDAVQKKFLRDITILGFIKRAVSANDKISYDANHIAVANIIANENVEQAMAYLEKVINEHEGAPVSSITELIEKNIDFSNKDKLLPILNMIIERQTTWVQARARVLLGSINDDKSFEIFITKNKALKLLVDLLKQYKNSNNVLKFAVDTATFTLCYEQGVIKWNYSNGEKKYDGEISINDNITISEKGEIDIKHTIDAQNFGSGGSNHYYLSLQIDEKNKKLRFKIGNYSYSEMLGDGKFYPMFEGHGILPELG